MGEYVTEIEVPRVAEYGRGNTQVIAVPSPGAGAGFTTTVPGAVEWCLDSVSFQLVSSVVAGTRVPLLSLDDGTGVPFFQALATAGQAPSKTTRYTFARDVQPAGATSDAQIVSVIPDLRLYAGLSLAVTVASLDAGDQVSGIRLFVSQYPIRPDND